MSNPKQAEVIRPSRPIPFNIDENLIDAFDMLSAPPKKDPSNQDAVLFGVERRIMQEDDPNAACAPLLELNYSKDIDSRQDTTVHGVFVEHEGKLVFAPTNEGRYTKYVTCSNLLPGVEMLIKFFAQYDVIIILRGRTTNHLFFVSEIHSGGIVRENGSTFTRVSNTAIQAICNRIRYDVRQLSDDALYTKGYILSQEAELQLLYSIVKPRLSLQQRDWVDHNLMRITAPHISREEKGHITRAVSYILNVNWKARPIKLPKYDKIKTHLDNQFYGIESVKARILEVIAQIRRSGTLPQWGILLNGPAGVGKTSIALEIAEVLNRRLVTIDLSTTNDPEALVGSSRIYNNAKPGVIVEKLLANRDSNCVMLLNELDKAAGGKDRGNPADTLLTLVDKLGFIDNFLETAIDSSNIFFIATCNDIDRISQPLQDRFLRIDIEGYSTQEKQTIFTDFVLPRTLEASNVLEAEVQVTEDFVEQLCKHYATEPGVRNLEQYAERIVGDFLLRHERDGIQSRTYGFSDIEPLFGRKASITRTVAVAPGQAKTIVCFEHKASQALIQVSCASGTGNFTVYGATTEYHKDCCHVAYECVKRLTRYNFESIDVALYITSYLPAIMQNYLGCAAFMAIMSAITNRQLPPNAVYLGGCDLSGNLFWDETNLTSVINCAESAGDTVLYGPVGLAELTKEMGSVIIAESINAAILFEISANQV